MHFQYCGIKPIIWHKKGYSNDPPFWLQIGWYRLRRHMRHMNLTAIRKKVHRKHVLMKIVVARSNVLCGYDFTKTYIDNEGWIYTPGR